MECHKGATFFIFSQFNVVFNTFMKLYHDWAKLILPWTWFCISLFGANPKRLPQTTVIVNGALRPTCPGHWQFSVKTWLEILEHERYHPNGLLEYHFKKILPFLVTYYTSMKFSSFHKIYDSSWVHFFETPCRTNRICTSYSRLFLLCPMQTCRMFAVPDCIH